MGTPATLHRYSFADHLAFEEASTTKHEFLNGEIYGMAGGTPSTPPSPWRYRPSCSRSCEAVRAASSAPTSV
jgi:hypothetical protein